ncbi:MAG: 30S ribosomal protein S19 [Candidatus Aenigmatarchaeota archaeon]
MAKIFLYQGKTIEEIQKMSLDEFIQTLPSRQRRTLRRGLTVIQKKFLERVRKHDGARGVKDKPIRTRSRDMPILPEMVGAKIAIHDGREYKLIVISPDMLGHYLGEFALTRKKVMHGAAGFGATRSSKFVPLK